ncbi:phospholipase D family protein [Aeromonas allosaccharophila]|uniref:phospholipase D family protein n=1 Tax=Aeromonas allosaccharophila TaxID=656 RepID=UPI000DD04091|nr:phospholipase D family protein [Aeromonas allosaccharophila]
MLLSNINNLQIDNLKTTIKNCDDRLIIVSPYLADDMKSFLSNFDFSSIQKIELITTFKPRDIEQIRKPFQLRDFYNFFDEKHPSISTKVHIDNNLHGKLYFSLGRRKELILTSGNFTPNGFFHNHEWGVLITDTEVIYDALNQVYELIEFQDVTRFQVERACQFADVYLGKNPHWLINEKIDYDILSSVYSDSDSNNNDPKYYLKPIGHKEAPITLEERRDFSDLHQNLHFSKKKPKGIKKGDVIITTAVGAGSLLSYFKVTSGLRSVTESQIKNNPWMERWPWYLEGKNNSVNFGGKWWEHNLRRQDMLSEFNTKYPGQPVTSAGGLTLGTINMGSDKVQLSELFAKFLISKIQKYNS